MHGEMPVRLVISTSWSGSPAKKASFSLIRIEDELARALGTKVDLVTETAVSPQPLPMQYTVMIYDAPRISITSLAP
jgi:hypothetical protein